jgi:hypothetical protein
MEGDEVRVASDKVLRVATDGEFKKFIVFWIAATRNFHIDFDPARVSCQGSEKASNIFHVDVPAKFFLVSTS